MSRLGGVVCLMLLLAGGGRAVAAGTGCDCEQKEGCAGKAAAADATIHPVAVNGAPVAVVRGGTFQPASARESEEALLTVVVFSDYQCPYCARGDETLKALAELYPGQLRVVMKQLPLPLHANARRAAIAALAAGEQGRYWELHEKLFANPRALDAAGLERLAAELRLDLPRFKAALADPALEQRVQADQAEAAALGVRGTPAYFINGRQIVGAQPVEVLRQVAAEELTRAQNALASGVPAAKLYETLVH